MENFSNIHWLAVVLATIASFILGGVWYHPKVFGGIWATSAAVELAPSSLAMIVTLAMTLIAASGFSLVMNMANLKGALSGISLGLLATIIFVLPAVIGQWLFMNRVPLFLVNMGFNTINLLIIGGIVGAWQK